MHTHAHTEKKEQTLELRPIVALTINIAYF